MEQKTSNVKVALTNGIFLGIALIFFSLILYILDVEREHWLQYLSFLIMFVGVFMAQKNWRDKFNEGFLSYGKAFSNGFLTILFSAILTSLYTFVFFELIAPGEIQIMFDAAEDKIYDKNPNISDAEFETAMKWASMMMKPWVLALWGLLASVFAALIISAITSIFIKKEQNQFV